MKVFTIVGARPQFIKAAVVGRAFRQYCSNVHEILCHTGQHFDANMSDVFFDELDIPRPDYNLGIGGGTHGRNTGLMLQKVEELMDAEAPDWVLVYGDTDSTLAGALAAAKLNIPVAHVEAGLRSFNRRMPEEINRVLSDHISTLLFAPSAAAMSNLNNEGISGSKVHKVGDVMYEAALYYWSRAEQTSRILERLKLSPQSYILATLHRQENVDNRDRLANILFGLGSCDKTVVLPLHPRTRKRLQEFELSLPQQVMVVEPVGYIDMVMLEKNAIIIATDSGGVQKEAYFHHVPCVTLRDETEWVELVECGANRLVGTEIATIRDSIAQITNFKHSGDLYGTGNSGRLIVEILNKFC